MISESTVLTDVSSHFAFGKNWQEYAQKVGADELDNAIQSLSKLISPEEMAGKSFLDIGCGSGLSMLAALRLGAGRAHGVDIDKNSVAAATRLLEKFPPDTPWSVTEESVFNLNPEQTGQFDIVHSWGVLHHTGSMWQAIGSAAAMIKPGGLFVLALYRETPLCAFWKHEKRLYAHGGQTTQKAIRSLFKGAYLLGIAATGRNPKGYIRSYKSNRGMDWHHDVHDWLGGYPYESVTPDQVLRHLQGHGFSLVRMFDKPPPFKGIFGTHCDEFVFRKTA